ncbi:phage/plasmid primase, P4 family [Kitasatospora sp. MAP5-34]|uniref:DNA primase family protein n=1 Tax=Kitasatospora sp. MAP5-34 TaxID=3035102 RepID=UPI002474DFF1|nr:phage/plasmid primase, P4 family [Kitasatospora sp. MAP5-34]MDH6580032.1 putative DNA primase/helicase [Kitasatospora sp. MAP5-34]
MTTAHGSAGPQPGDPTTDTNQTQPRSSIPLNRPSRFFKKEIGLLLTKLVAAVENEGPIAVDYTGHLYAYTEGVWRDNGERIVSERVFRLLGDRGRRTHVSNVLASLSCQPPLFTDENQDTQFLNLPNGLLDWRTGELSPHDPAIPSTIRIPVEWDPDAKCPAIEQWLEEVFPSDTREFIEEVIGYTLFNANPLNKAVLLNGPGRNGKGTFLKLVKSLAGGANISAVSPQSLDENRFMVAELHGKLANLVGDVDPRIFKATENFKKVTGEDPLNAERKYGQPFKFTCRALLIAAFNALPRSADTTEGFFSRWIVLPFTGYFPAGVADPNQLDKLTTPSELRGLLVLAVHGLVRLMARNCFDPPQSVRQETDDYRLIADPVRAFLADGQLAGWIPRTALYARYVDWAQVNGYHQLAAATFYERADAASTDPTSPTMAPRKRRGTRGYWFGDEVGQKDGEESKWSQSEWSPSAFGQ